MESEEAPEAYPMEEASTSGAPCEEQEGEEEGGKGEEEEEVEGGEEEVDEEEGEEKDEEEGDEEDDEEAQLAAFKKKVYCMHGQHM